MARIAPAYINGAIDILLRGDDTGEIGYLPSTLYLALLTTAPYTVSDQYLAFDTEDEVTARANATEYGLVAYIHTQDPRRIYRLSRALQFGMVAVNRTKVTGAPIPFGGMKQSGLGREGSRLGMEEFTEIKYVCRDWA